MYLYMNCYAAGEGYTLKRSVYPALPPLEEIRLGDLPEAEAAVFTGPAAPYLFLGALEGLRFGCVREIETPLRDENGRRCFLHIALEAADSGEARLVDAILLFALRRRSRFALLCNRMTADQSRDYRLEPEAFRTLAAEAEADASAPAPGGLLIPQTSPEDFFANAGGAWEREAITVPLSFEKWKDQEAFMDLFFYCSTPSMGFVLCQIDPITGEKLRTDREANERMLPWAQSILTQSGAALARFARDGKACFVVRDVQSASVDRYGRRKKLSLVVQTPEDQDLPVRQLAAWALADFAAFSEALTDCVKVFDGPRGYEVRGEKLAELLDRLSRPIRLPEGNPQRGLWASVAGPAAGHVFPCLVREASLAYFCRSCNISITEKDVGLLLSAEDWEEIRKRPAGIVFGPELYAEPEAAEKAPVPPEGPEVEKPPAAGIKTAPEERETAPTPQPEPVPEFKPEPAPETRRAAVREAPAPAAEKPAAEAKTEAPAPSADKPERERPDYPEEERIDLLKQRWFWPAVGLLALAIAGGAALWLYLRG